MEIIECTQGTDDWLRARAGVPTASEFHTILAKGEGKTRRAYLYRLAGEIVTGEPAETFKSPAMERGNLMEDEAREMYAFIRRAEPVRVGFVRNGRAGCSPDSLLGDDGGLEIKTKRADILIDVLLKDEVPPEHRAQLQGFLWITERKWVDFVAYWPGLPLFVKRVERDEDYIATLSAEVAKFCDELDAVVERIRGWGEAA
jgi:predicted phage-related endonuclease